MASFLVKDAKGFSRDQFAIDESTDVQETNSV
jgi:hypothetical protein